MIVAVDGHPAETVTELQRPLGGECFGASVTFTVARHERVLDVVSFRRAGGAERTDIGGRASGLGIEGCAYAARSRQTCSDHVGPKEDRGGTMVEDLVALGSARERTCEPSGNDRVCRLISRSRADADLPSLRLEA